MLYALLLCLLVLDAARLSTSSDDACFTAAVYEHIQQGNELFESPKDVINKNLKIYENVAGLASSAGAQIIVFPEDGIFNAFAARALTRKYLETIPNEMSKYRPCNDSLFSNHTILSTLSCIASKNGLYVISDMGEVVSCNRHTDKSCPSDGFYQYNTAVVFDNRGYLVAKYHKYHLFGELGYNIPKKQEFVTFETPFGKFGVFICFDLIFEEPGIRLVEEKHVDSIALSTWWFDEIPFLAAHQYQQAWAMRNRVNVLAANINKIWLGSTGSGIYSGARGAVIYQHNVVNQTANLLVASLKVKSSSNASCDKVRRNIPIDIPKSESTKPRTYNFQHIDPSVFEHVPLKKQQDHVTACQHGACCSLKYSFGRKPENVFLGAASRVRKIPLGYRWCEQMCVMYTYDKRSSKYVIADGIPAESIELSGNFSTSYIYPSVLGANLKLLPTTDWSFTREGSQAQVLVKHPKTAVNTVAFYGRCYKEDPPYP